ncbi:MAG: glutamine amidotransferase [Ruminococcaceae bacterium]|nr:glutamine amidotransferase [Oscillospiraceae bacterium]
MKLTIGHIYPDILNLYGDKGNIVSLSRRLKLRNIDFEIVIIEDKIDFANIDILILGGGSDRDTLIANNKLQKQKDELKNFVESDGTLLALCSGYHILGKEFKINEKAIDGLGIFDITTKQIKNRLIGNIILECECINNTVVGFENHNTITDIKDYTPFGIVKYGYGNSEEKTYEGLIYKNTIATNLHGPLLPKNPRLTDYILNNALNKKYGDVSLSPLDDTFENNAHDYIIKRFLKNSVN